MPTVSPPDKADQVAPLAGEPEFAPYKTFSPRYRAYVLVLLTLSYVFNFVDRQVMTILLEPIKAEFGVSDSAMGLLSGLASSQSSVVSKPSPSRSACTTRLGKGANNRPVGPFAVSSEVPTVLGACPADSSSCLPPSFCSLGWASSVTVKESVPW